MGRKIELVVFLAVFPLKMRDLIPSSKLVPRTVAESSEVGVGFVDEMLERHILVCEEPDDLIADIFARRRRFWP